MPRERGVPTAKGSSGGAPFGEGASSPRAAACVRDGSAGQSLRVSRGGRARAAPRARCHRAPLAACWFATCSRFFFPAGDGWSMACWAAARGMRRGLCLRPGAWRSGEAAPCRAPVPPDPCTGWEHSHRRRPHATKESYPLAHLRHRFRYIGWLVRKHDPAPNFLFLYWCSIP